jgi:hypothetical protein
MENSVIMADQSIQELESRSLARVASAGSPEELEAVRVEALGRAISSGLPALFLASIWTDDHGTPGSVGMS